MADVEWKKRGNRLFAQHKFREACECYSRAIEQKATTGCYWSNRALCWLKLQQWAKAAEDCKKAVEIDKYTVKGHFYLGQALTELQQCDEALVYFRRAQTLAQDQKLCCGDEIASAARSARRRRWENLERQRLSEEVELQSYLEKLMLEDRDRQKEILEKETKGSENLDNKLSAVDAEYDLRGRELREVFAAGDACRQKREVPDYLCGRISFELLRDPVITPSGVTYERRDIEEHLVRVGHFDPVTREELTMDMLIPNLALKEVIDAFVSENEWAVDY